MADAFGVSREPRTWQGNAALVAACIFLVVLPITHTVALRGLMLATLAPLTIFVAWRWRSSLPGFPLIWPFLTWLALGLLSLSWSIDVDYSQGEFRNEMLYPAMACFTFFVLTRTTREFHTFAKVLLLSAGGSAVAGIVGYLGAGEWQITRGFGVGDAGAYSTYAILVLPAFILLVLWPANGINARFRLVAGTVALVTLVAVALTSNRAAWITLAVGCIAYLLLAYRYGDRKDRSSKQKSAAVVALVVLLLAAAFVATNKQKAVRHSMVDDESGVAFLTTDARHRIWEYASIRLSERPLLGYGFGRGILRQDFRQANHSKLMWHGHNMFINYALELGVAGLGVLLWLFWSLFRTLARLCSSNDRNARFAGTLGILVLACMLTKVQFDDLLVRETSLLFWSLMGMCLGWGLRLDQAPPPST